MDTSIVITISDQRLRLYRGEACLATYPISSGKTGCGTQEGSGKTPLGHFIIDECIGEGLDEGTIFRSRQAVGTYPSDIPEGMDESSDLILTRILRLDGLEEENANTKARFIYIHGTNRVDLLGSPASCGCIRMSPQDMMRLFRDVRQGTLVEILP